VSPLQYFIAQRNVR